jgi:hypothetical protein
VVIADQRPEVEDVPCADPAATFTPARDDVFPQGVDLGRLYSGPLFSGAKTSASL